MNFFKRLGAAAAETVGFREGLLFAGAALIGAGVWLVNPGAGLATAGAILVYVSIAGVK